MQSFSYENVNTVFTFSSSDGLTIPSGAIIPEMSGSHFSPFSKSNAAFSTGEQSSFSSSHSGSSGSSQYFDQQQFSPLPVDSKITTVKKHEMKKVVTKSSSGLSGNPGVTGEFDVVSIHTRITRVYQVNMYLHN